MGGFRKHAEQEGIKVFFIIEGSGKKLCDVFR
jgi:hypothetical protein